MSSHKHYLSAEEKEAGVPPAQRHRPDPVAASSSTDAMHDGMGDVQVKQEPSSSPLRPASPIPGADADLSSFANTALGYGQFVDLTLAHPHLIRASAAYKQKKYGEAMGHLDMVPDLDMNKDALKLYTSCHSNMGQTQQGEAAIASFTKASDKVGMRLAHSDLLTPERILLLRYRSACHQEIAKHQPAEAAIASYTKAIADHKEIFDNEDIPWDERVIACDKLAMLYTNIAKLQPARTALAGQQQLIASYQQQRDDVNASWPS